MVQKKKTKKYLLEKKLLHLSIIAQSHPVQETIVERIPLGP